MTIFLTTHYLDEADQLSDRVSIIDRGRVLRTGSPAALKEALGSDVVLVRPADTARDIAPLLQGIPGVLSVAPRTRNGEYRIKIPRAESFVPAIVRACDAEGVELAAVSTRKPSLEEVFLTVTGHEYADDPEGGHRTGGPVPTVGPGGR